MLYWLTRSSISPDEAPQLVVPANVGVTAATVRSELVVLATALNAGVPASSVRYIFNANGTATSDFIQVCQNPAVTEDRYTD